MGIPLWIDCSIISCPYLPYWKISTIDSHSKFLIRKTTYLAVTPFHLWVSMW
jgi:hypothetical protein